MMKPRKGKVGCEKQAVTIVSVISVAASWLLATSHPGLSGAEFIVGCFREQVNSLSMGKMHAGNSDTRLVSESGGRPGHSSVEDSGMEMERRAWLVGVTKERQLKSNFRMTDYFETKSQPISKLITGSGYSHEAHYLFCDYQQEELPTKFGTGCVR